jgi:probable rRNA maturation factor
MPRRSPRPSASPVDRRVRLSVLGGPYAGVGRATLRRRAERMLDALGLGDVELSLAVVGDEAMRRLNRSYRRQDRPTDVLAFAMAEGEQAPATRPELLGDVVLCVDAARRQARAQKHPLLAELTMLLAHGLLHLLGHDHPSRAAAREMAARVAALVRAATTRR